MEENLKVSIKWEEILTIAVLACLLISHNQNGNETVLTILAIAMIIKTTLSMISLHNTQKMAGGFAQSILMGDNYISTIVKSMSPLSTVQVTLFIIYSAFAFYIGHNYNVYVGIACIIPFIYSLFVYNSILRNVADPTLQKFTNDLMDINEKEEKRNLIFNDEINKIMPVVWENVKKRWIEEGLQMEEDNEHNEPDESDKIRQSTTHSDD